MTSPTSTDERARIQPLVDELITHWPSGAWQGETLTPAFFEAQEATNVEVRAGKLPEVIWCAAMNLAYRIMVDQEITELPREAHLAIGASTSVQGDFAQIAFTKASAWAYGLGRGDLEPQLEITLLSLTRQGEAMQILQTICDIAADLRDGRAEVTFTPWDDEEREQILREHGYLEGDDPADERKVETVDVDPDKL